MAREERGVLLTELSSAIYVYAQCVPVPVHLYLHLHLHFLYVSTHSVCLHICTQSDGVFPGFCVE